MFNQQMLLQTNLTPPTSRDIVIVEGFQLKPGAAVADFETRGFDQNSNADPNNPRPGRSILSSSTAIYCEVRAGHSAAWERIDARVRCGDGGWSAWTSVNKNG